MRRCDGEKLKIRGCKGWKVGRLESWKVRRFESGEIAARFWIFMVVICVPLAKYTSGAHLT